MEYELLVNLAGNALTNEIWISFDYQVGRLLGYILGLTPLKRSLTVIDFELDLGPETFLGAQSNPRHAPVSNMEPDSSDRIAVRRTLCIVWH